MNSTDARVDANSPCVVSNAWLFRVCLEKQVELEFYSINGVYNVLGSVSFSCKSKIFPLYILNPRKKVQDGKERNSMTDVY